MNDKKWIRLKLLKKFLCIILRYVCIIFKKNQKICEDYSELFRFNSSKPGTQEAGYYKGGVYYLPRRRGGICSGFDVNNARKQQGPTVEDQFKRKLSNHSIIPFKSSLHPPLLPSLPYIPPSSPLLFTIIFLYYIYCRKPRFIIQSGLVHGFRSSLKRFPTQPYSG